MRVSIWMAMLCFCFSNDVQSRQKFNVIQSDSVIFENVKSVTTTKSSWKLGLVYDMSGFDALLDKIQSDTHWVQNFTNKAISQMTSSADILNNEQLKQSLSNLIYEANHLESSRLALLAEYDDYATLYRPKTRKRRALLPFIGSALKFLNTMLFNLEIIKKQLFM